MLIRILAGALAALLAAPAPAHAQLTAEQSDEVYCVAIQFAAVEDDAVREAIAMVYVTDDLSETVSKIASDAIKPIVDECTAHYKWTSNDSGHALNIGLLDQSISWLEDAAADLGAPDSLVNDYSSILHSLDAQEELDALMLGHWKDDDALRAKMRRILVAHGVPDEDTVIEFATTMMGNIQAYGVETDRFIAARFPE